MLNKTKITSFFLAFFLVLFTGDGFCRSVDSRDVNGQNVESAKIYTSQERNGKILPIDGVLHSIIRLNENNLPSFELLNKNKKDARHYPSSHASVFLATSYTFYLANRINSITFYHFYIAYRRLII